jgi:hypothetical protein
MTTDTKWRLHNITYKASLCYGSENWIINKRDAQKLEAVQMRFPRPLLGLTRLDRQRNPEIRNNLKVDNIVEDIKQYQLPGTIGWKPPTEAGFPVPTSGMAG